jgi:integrase
LATFKKLNSGSWRVQVRRKGRYLSETFQRHADAQEWSIAIEHKIDRGETPTKWSRIDPTTFGHLIDLHINDLKEVGKAPRRSKAFVVDALQAKLGAVRLCDLSRERLIQFGKDRAREGAGGVTIGMDISYIKLVISHAAAVHGIAVSPEPVDLARIALKRLGLISKGRERDRRPTEDELAQIIAHLEQNPRQIIPVARIVKFAVATAMRQEELTRIRWDDVDALSRTVTIRDRKDPRDKIGNDQKVPLLDATGFDAWALLQEQKPFAGRSDRVFPYNGRSVGTAFRRTCRKLKIKDLQSTTFAMRRRAACSRRSSPSSRSRW